MKKKNDSQTVSDRTRQEARRDFIKKVGAAAGAAAVTGAALSRQGADAVHAQTRETTPRPIGGRQQANKFFEAEKKPAAIVDPRAGVVVANAAGVRLVLNGLREKMKRDEALKRRFQDNPRQVLGSVGLNEEIQSEILRELPKLSTGGGEIQASWCWCTGCCCTNCCLVSNCSGGSIGL
jgi:hypothetical protein